MCRGTRGFRAPWMCAALALFWGLNTPSAHADGGFPQFSPGGLIELVGTFDPSPADLSSDIWGWIDPATGKEYAIIGEWTGRQIFIIDCSNPSSPQLVSTIDDIPSFDFKTWGTYLYGVDGNGNNDDGEVYDISDPANPVFVGNFLSAHNIFIDDRGYMYNEVGGVSILDLNANPQNPSVIWSGGNPSAGHDATVVGDRLFDFHGGAGTFIWDVANPASPSLLGSIQCCGMIYQHSGWPSADGNTLYINDELSSNPQPDIMVFDISNPASAVNIDNYSDPNSTIHNSYRVGNYLYASYYRAGFRVFDVSDPNAITLADEYDTLPSQSGEGFRGCWGVYPFMPSGNIYASDMDGGLFIFRFAPAATDAPLFETPTNFTLAQNAPNPVRFQGTTIRFDLTQGSPVSLAIFNTLGQRVRTLVSDSRSAGSHDVHWDGRDHNGRSVAAGTYFYRLATDRHAEAKPLVVTR